MYYIANTAEAQLKHITTEDMIVYQVGELYKNKYFLSCFNTIYTENGSLGRKQFIPHILCKSIALNFEKSLYASSIIAITFTFLFSSIFS